MDRRGWLLVGAGVTALVLATLALRAAPMAARRSGHLPLGEVRLAADSVVVPMGSWQGRSLVDLTLDGRGPFPFVLDTGAHGSILTRALSDSLGLATLGSVDVGSPAGGTPVKGRIVRIERAALGGDAITLSFTSVAAEFARIPGPGPLWGALAPRDFHGHTITWDFPRRRFVIRRGALPEPDGGEVSSYAGEDLPTVPLTIGGRTLTVHLDTGSAAGLSLPRSLESTLALAAPPVPGRTARNVDREVRMLSATLAEPVVLGGRVYPALAVELFPNERHPVIGCGLLAEFEVTLDPEHERIRLHRP